MLTVYFDTSFYVDLGAADEPAATRVVDALNLLEVRHVLSPVVFSELARAGDRSELHLTMLERLARFARPPLNLSPSDNWLALAPGDHREQLAAASAVDEGGHAELFARFADAIDLLQLTEAEHRALAGAGDHPLRRLGLAERCFASPSFAALPELLAARSRA